MDEATAPRSEEIYVGYRPVPRRIQRTVRASVGALLVVGIGVGVLVAEAMRPAGSGEWAAGIDVDIEGTMRLMPYPHLETSEGPVLLVEPGKFGAQARFDGAEGARVSLRGSTLSRGRWRMLEIAEHTIKAEPANVDRSELSATRAVVATGEILDSKCYLGAMKPGDGPTHKACAMLCLRGGIPAIFVGRTTDGQWIDAVVRGSDGGPMHESLIGFVGETVTIRGELGVLGSLPVVSLSPETVTRVR